MPWICNERTFWLARRKLPVGSRVKLQVADYKLDGGRRVFIGFRPGDVDRDYNLYYSTQGKDWSFPNGVQADPMFGSLSRFFYAQFPGFTATPKMFYVRLITKP